MLDFAATHASLKHRPTETLTSLALRLCRVKTADNITTVNAAMFILMKRLDHHDFNALWAQLEDAGFQAGDEAEQDPLDDFNYVGSRHHY